MIKEFEEFERELKVISEKLKIFEQEFELNTEKIFPENEEISVNSLLNEGKSFREINKMYKIKEEMKKDKDSSDMLKTSRNNLYEKAWDIYNKKFV